MRRTITAGALLLASAAASGWPARDTPQDELAWCKGFVATALQHEGVADGLRTELWLAWNYLIRAGALQHDDDSAGYAAGRARLTADMDADALHRILDEAADDGDCGLNRAGYQTTGW